MANVSPVQGPVQDTGVAAPHGRPRSDQAVAPCRSEHPVAAGAVAADREPELLLGAEVVVAARREPPMADANRRIVRERRPDLARVDALRGLRTRAEKSANHENLPLSTPWI